jgi:hypothetical protein
MMSNKNNSKRLFENSEDPHLNPLPKGEEARTRVVPRTLAPTKTWRERVAQRAG